MAFPRKCWVLKSADECYPDLMGQHLSLKPTTIPAAPLSFPPAPLPFHSLAKLRDKREEKKTSAERERETRGVWMRTQWTKHAVILQGRQKKCPLEQWQQSAGQRRRGWPWQITNKRMDKTSLARQKPPWKSTVSRKGPRNSIQPFYWFVGSFKLLK